LNIPATITAGDSISWQDHATTSGDTAISSPTWALTYYLRMNTAGEGATVTGAADGAGGWDLTIAAATTAGFNAGSWYWQAQASSGGVIITLASGTLEVLPSMAYTSTPAAFDGRSEAEKELAEVQAAIRSIQTGGVSQYGIGHRGGSNRYATKLDLGELYRRESHLKGIIARERAAEKVAAGLGDPRNLFVRFGR
jgi:hypothetical protein